MLVAVGSAVLLGWPVLSQAGAKTGPYLGAGVGTARLRARTDLPGGGSTTVSGHEPAYKVTLGYNFGWIPFVDLGVEGSYLNFGKVSKSVGGTKVSYEQTGWDGFGLAGVSLGPVGVFAKTGFINWHSDIKADGFKRSDSSTDPAYGIGARLRFFSLSGRLEYEKFDLSGNKDVEMTSVSVLYTF